MSLYNVVKCKKCKRVEKEGEKGFVLIVDTEWSPPKPSYWLCPEHQKE